MKRSGTALFFLFVLAVLSTGLFGQATEVIRIIDPDNGPGTDYTSLSDFARLEERDLVAANEIAVAVCRSSNGTADRSAQFTGWTTDAEHYVKIVADEGHRATAKWDSSKYRIIENSTGNSECIDIEISHIMIDGIQMRLSGSGNKNDVIDAQPQPGKITIQNCFLWLDVEVQSGTIMDPGSDLEVSNCIIKSSGGGINAIHLKGNVEPQPVATIYNNTFVGGWFRAMRNEGIARVKNNLIRGAVGDEIFVTADDGEYTNDSDYNSTNVSGTALVNSPRNNTESPWFNADLTDEDIFVDPANNDFHVKTSSPFIAAGIGPAADSNVPATDIDGDGRFGGDAADLGADEHGSLAPVAGADVATTLEDFPVTVFVLTNDFDPDGEPISLVSAEAGDSASAIINADSVSITYTPPENFFGVTEFNYTIRDSVGAFTTGIVTVTVEPVNDAPIVSLPPISFDEDDSTTVDLNDYVEDIDSDSASISWSYAFPNTGSKAPGNVEIQNENIIVEIDTAANIARLKAAPNFFGSGIAVIFSAADGDGGASSDTTSVTVNAVGDPPVVSVPDLNIVEDFTVTIDLDTVVMDIDTDTSQISWDIVVNSVNLVPAFDNLTHKLTLTPAQEFSGSGILVFFTATDDSGNSSSDTMLVNIFSVNDPPTIASALPAFSFDEDNFLQIPASFWGDFISDVDDSSSALSWIIGSGSFISADLTNDIYNFSAPANWFGVDTLSLIASDGNSSSTAKITMTVDPVNDPPQISIPVIIFPENAILEIDLDTMIVDIDSDTAEITWSYSLDSENVFVTLDPGTHIMSFSAAPNFNTPGIPLEITAVDNGGLVASQTTSILVLEVDSPPSFSSELPELSFQEDGNLIIPATFWLNFADDPDTPDSLLSFSVVPGSAVMTEVTNNGYQFTAPPDWFGSDTVKWVVDDRFSTDTANVVFSVTPVNDPPVVKIPPIKFPENSTFVMDLDTVVTDIDTDTSLITWQIDSPEEVLKGLPDGLIINLDSVTHKVEISAEDGFTPENTPLIFTATDDHSESHSDTTMVSLDLVNDAPVFAVELPLLTFPEDDSLTVPISNFYPFVHDEEQPDSSLFWDFYPKGNLYASIDDDSNSVTFSALANWFGGDTVFISASDGLLSDTSHFLIIVTPVNDAPVVSEFLPDTIVAGLDSSIVLNIWDVVEDDDTADSLLTFAFTADPDSVHMDFDAGTGRLVISPSSTVFTDPINITMTIQDDGNAETAHTFAVIFQPLTGIEDIAAGSVPGEFLLMQNYPNPFNPSTQIQFALPQASEVKISVYNIVGEHVATLTEGRKSAGYHIVNFDAGHLSSGFYFYKFEASEFVEVRKMILMK